MSTSAEKTKSPYRASRLSRAAVALAALAFVGGKAEAEPLSRADAAPTAVNSFNLYNA
jgi:hypothetical protein